MKEKFQLLEIIYDIGGEGTLPFTEYLGEFQDRLGIPVKNILGIYSQLLEEGYIKTSRQDRIYFTHKGLESVLSLEKSKIQT